VYDVDVVMDLAHQVGTCIANEFSTIEAEDVTQEVLMDLYEKEHRLSSDDPDYLYKVMYDAGRRYAAGSLYDNVVATAEIVYNRDEVKALLKEVTLDEETLEHDDKYVYGTISKKRGRVCTRLSNLQAAWKELSDSHRGTLLRKYRDGEDVHHELVNRAAEALTRALNIYLNQGGSHEGPGSRNVMSNARAQFETGEQW
jgi:hypothetical protein